MAILVDPYAHIAQPSRLPVKRYIDVEMGVVDADYCGELGVILIDNSDDELRVQQGDQIAQLILEKISTLAVEEVSALDDTGRGAIGFGSIGMQSGPIDNFGESSGIFLPMIEEQST